MATTIFERPSSEFARQFWNASTSMSVPLAENQKTYIAWCASSSAGTSGGMMDSASGAVILVSNGKYAVIHKGSGITVSSENSTLTITSNSEISMGLVEI